jgi:hypothetical protein
MSHAARGRGPEGSAASGALAIIPLLRPDRPESWAVCSSGRASRLALTMNGPTLSCRCDSESCMLDHPALHSLVSLRRTFVAYQPAHHRREVIATVGEALRYLVHLPAKLDGFHWAFASTGLCWAHWRAARRTSTTPLGCSRKRFGLTTFSLGCSRGLTPAPCGGRAPSRPGDTYRRRAGQIQPTWQCLGWPCLQALALCSTSHRSRA